MATKNVSNIAAFVESQNGKPVFVGIDVHKKEYHVSLLGADGMSVQYVADAKPIPFTHQLLDWGLNIRLIAYEAGPTGFPLVRALTGAGFNAIVVAPSRVPRQVTPGAKTDRLDCIKLARLAAGGMLRGIAVPTAEQEADRSISRRRGDLSKSIRQIKQRIKSNLLMVGVEEPKGLANWSSKAVAALERLPVLPNFQRVLNRLVRELKSLILERGRIDSELREFAESKEHHEAIASLRSVPGVGLVIATTFYTELFDIIRFYSGEEVASYLGLAPMVRQSGEGKSKGRLCQVGQARLRALLVEAVWI